MERKRKAKKRKGRAERAEAEPLAVERECCLKRGLWADHCIPTKERFDLLEEIKHWLGRVKTRELPEILAMIADRSDKAPQSIPVFITKVPRDYDPRKGSFVVLGAVDEKEDDPNGVRVVLDLDGPFALTGAK